MLQQAQAQNAALQEQLMASERANEEICIRVAELLTRHVMVCLERDELRRFRAVSSFIVVVLIAIVLFTKV